MIKLFDDNPSTVFAVAKQKHCEHFEGLEISIPRLYKHIQEKYTVSLKQTIKYTLERDAPKTIELRFNVISRWKAAGVNFQENCMFVDEAGFHSQLMRGRACSRVGDPAVVKVHTQKNVNINIVGCISPSGRIYFSKVEPLKKSDAVKIEKKFPESTLSKKRKAGTQSDPKPVTLKKGTTAYRVINFMESAMNILDKHDMNDMLVVMKNCIIYYYRFIVDIVNA